MSHTLDLLGHSTLESKAATLGTPPVTVDRDQGTGTGYHPLKLTTITSD